MDRRPGDVVDVPEPVVLWIPGADARVAPVPPELVGGRSNALVVALLAVILALSAALMITWPRASAFGPVAEENRALRDEVQAMEALVRDGERTIALVRQYNAQLTSLMKSRGASGGGLGIDEDLFANAGLEDAGDDDGLPTDEGGPILTAETPGVGWSADALEGASYQPAEAFAADVRQRLKALIEVVRRDRSDLEEVLAQLESVDAVVDAMPDLWPTKGRGIITSGFGWRSDPIHRSTRFHAGLDIADDRGTPIYAVAPGVVLRAETQSGYGRVIDIDHGYGITTRYAHCTSLRVKEGQRVERGDYIATMGSTGKSTGPHLHFELRIDGAPHDPLSYLPSHASRDGAASASRGDALAPRPR